MWRNKECKGGEKPAPTTFSLLLPSERGEERGREVRKKNGAREKSKGKGREEAAQPFSVLPAHFHPGKRERKEKVEKYDVRTEKKR